jgi:hypothetical protein
MAELFFLRTHCLHIWCVMKRKFKHCSSTIPPISTTRTVTSHLNSRGEGEETGNHDIRRWKSRSLRCIKTWRRVQNQNDIAVTWTCYFDSTSNKLINTLHFVICTSLILFERYILQDMKCITIWSPSLINILKNS